MLSSHLDVVLRACWMHVQLMPLTVLLDQSAGYFLETTAVAPTIWTESFLPAAAIEPILPDPHKPDEPVQFQEVFASDSEVCHAWHP